MQSKLNCYEIITKASFQLSSNENNTIFWIQNFQANDEFNLEIFQELEKFSEVC